MQALTYSHIQSIVNQIPESKLTIAYNFLIELAEPNETNFPTKLSLSEKHKLLEKQAYQMISHYEQTESKRQEWQAGDFIDEY
ncbi:MAG: hypothetical protein OMM_07557 [Candidatus Magnetoglobus multicellularis str. Araruama]|jgi:hypothetical protein|uniref:DUF2281 domain-containing protein n=1 Tax=Candidatus Magnetoglobus multicellularis str. Araruama TaxID=890399 RepID=A0A1V1PCE0_9BACT|nr:MAG: hypothetical protein OMM_07557 [Candidatus Magnetoglobus multicellularis str. Araruama]